MKIETNQSCYVCNSHDIKHIETRNPQYWTEYGSEILADRQIYFCNSCHFSFSYPFVPEDKLNKFYSVDFPKKRPEISVAYDMGFNLPTLLKIMLARQYMNFDSKKNILEIGAAHPYSLKSIVKLGINANIFSIESPDVDKEPFLKEGIEVIDCDLTINNVFKKTDKKMDVIFSNHVLEHFNANKLDNVIKNINGFLSLDGLFVFDLPSDDMSPYLEKGIRNQGFHLAHYTKRGMTIHLERMGFKVLYCEVTGTERNHDNYSYPEVPYKKTSEILEASAFPDQQRPGRTSPQHNTSKFKSIFKKNVPIKVLNLLRIFRDFVFNIRDFVFNKNIDILFKNDTLVDFLMQDISCYNPNGQNLRVCAIKKSHID